MSCDLVHVDVAQSTCEIIMSYVGCDEPLVTTRKRGRNGTDSYHFQISTKVCSFFKTYIAQTPSPFNFDPYLSKTTYDRCPLTRYLDPFERPALNKGITCSEINAFAKILGTQGGVKFIASDLMQNTDGRWIPQQALHAYFNGLISKVQVVSMWILSAAKQQFPNENIETYSIAEEPLLVEKYFNLSSAQVNCLIADSRKWPDSERYYHAITTLLVPIEKWAPGLKRLIEDIQIFKPITTLNSYYQITVIPSMSLVNGYIQLLFGKVIRWSFHLGKMAPVEVAMDKFSDLHPLQLGVPQAPISTSTDQDVYLAPFDFILNGLHDAVRSAETGLGLRATKFIVQHVLGQLCQNSVTPSINQKLLQGEYLYRRGQKFGDLLSSPHIPWTEIHVDAIILNMVMLSWYWRSAFDIGPESLYPDQRVQYDNYKCSLTKEQKQEAQKLLFDYYIKNTPTDPWNQFHLGCMFERGYGTPISFFNALACWHKAGDLCVALYKIGKCYERGLGVEYSLKEAIRYYMRARKRSPCAHHALGLIYYHGKGDVTPHFTRALSHFQQAALSHHWDAAYCAGLMYKKGQGTPCNKQIALRVLTRAADHGHCRAAYEVGSLYWEMDGTAQNPEKALFYLNKAVEQGSILAQQKVDEINGTIWQQAGPLLPQLLADLSCMQNLGDETDFKAFPFSIDES